MKTFVFFCLLSGIATAQTIRIADNNANRPAGTNIYSTIQAAVDAAASGDIVYVQPSLTSYGDVTINKKITLRGIGFNTGKDLAYNSIVSNIGLTNKIDNTDNATGTTIEGLIANDIYVGYKTGSFDYILKNITIDNCVVNARVWRENGYLPVENLTIANSSISIAFRLANITQLLVYRNRLNNFMFGDINYGSTLTSAVFSNNIIPQGASNGIWRTVAINGLIITNNNFLGGANVSGSRFITNCPVNAFCWSEFGLLDAIVTNNIFYGCAPNTNGPYFDRNVFHNNLSFGTTNNALPPAGTSSGNTGSNNKENQDPLFVNAAYNSNYANANNFNLQSGSPAKNAGSDGTDIGITGGAYALTLTSGNILFKPTSVPVILQLNPAALVPQNQPVKTNIKAKGN